MKVIQQLIDYFRKHGALTDEQIAQLRAQGFIAVDSDDWDDEQYYRGYSGDGSPTDIETIAEQFERFAPPRRYGRRAVPNGTLAIRELSQRLAALMPAWDEPLQALVETARLIEPCASWRQAVVTLRNASPRC
ncbi:MAG: hypothetical protein R3F37_00035 [Candidatus Competibacteraceae bacterium]